MVLATREKKAILGNRSTGILDLGDLSELVLPNNFEDSGDGQYENAYTLGVQAYIFGFPFIYLSQLRWLWTTEAGAKVLEQEGAVEGTFPQAPINSFWCSQNLASPSSGTGTGGSPNVDTLYSVAWCDLSRGPLVISVPAVTDRYYCIEMSGIDSDTYGYVGTRATGTAAGNYLIAGPHWNGTIQQQSGNPVLDVLPRACYPSILLLGRTGINNYSSADLDEARRIQSQYKLTPLAEWEGRAEVPRPRKAQVPVGFNYNNTLGAWLTMNRAMTENPPGVPPSIRQDQLLQLFAQIGIGPNQHLQFQSPITLLALHRAANTGLEILKKSAKSMGTLVNGWSYPPLNFGRAGQDEDYLVRSALQALAGITAHWTIEAVYLNTAEDSDGNNLSGADEYTLTFEADSFPPFESEEFGFWSITMYDSTYNLVGGSDHYTVNSYAPKYSQRSAAGGMKIYISSTDPGIEADEPGSYWLQSPSPSDNGGEFYMVLRVYIPAPSVAATQTWVPPSVVKKQAVQGSVYDREDMRASREGEAAHDALDLSGTSWPMIHCRPEGTKNCPLPGPANTSPTSQFLQDVSVIIMVTGRDLLYLQPNADQLFCYAFNDLSKPVHRVEFGAQYPQVGGGVVDDQGNLWFTRNGNMVRFSEGLLDPIISETFTPTDAIYNGLGLMTDGNALITSTTWAHVLATSLNDAGGFSLLSSLNLTEVSYEGVNVFPDSGPKLASRPVYGDNDGVYMNSAEYLVKMRYDKENTRLDPQPVWALEDPQQNGRINLSNPILVNENVWAVSQPTQDQPMPVYCVSRDNGALIQTIVPFPQALGKYSDHTLGADPDRGLVFVICNDNAGKGGVAAINISNFDVAWRLPLNNISEAFGLSVPSGPLYISNQENEDAPFSVWAIALENGEGRIIYTREADGNPPPSLPSIGPDGNLYYPYNDGLIRLQDKN